MKIDLPRKKKKAYIKQFGRQSYVETKNERFALEIKRELKRHVLKEAKKHFLSKNTPTRISDMKVGPDGEIVFQIEIPISLISLNFTVTPDGVEFN